MAPGKWLTSYSSRVRTSMSSGTTSLLAAIRSASSRVFIWGTSGQSLWIQAKTASQVSGSFGAASIVRLTIAAIPVSKKTRATAVLKAPRDCLSWKRELGKVLTLLIASPPVGDKFTLVVLSVMASRNWDEELILNTFFARAILTEFLLGISLAVRIAANGPNSRTR